MKELILRIDLKCGIRQDIDIVTFRCIYNKLVHMGGYTSADKGHVIVQ